MNINVDITWAFRNVLMSTFGGIAAASMVLGATSARIFCEQQINLLAENKLITYSVYMHMNTAKQLLINLKPDITEAEISYVINSVFD